MGEEHDFIYISHLFRILLEVFEAKFMNIATPKLHVISLIYDSSGRQQWNAKAIHIDKRIFDVNYIYLSHIVYTLEHEMVTEEIVHLQMWLLLPAVQDLRGRQQCKLCVMQTQFFPLPWEVCVSVPQRYVSLMFESYSFFVANEDDDFFPLDKRCHSEN